jgi:hypothetical protein
MAVSTETEAGASRRRASWWPWPWQWQWQWPQLQSRPWATWTRWLPPVSGQSALGFALVPLVGVHAYVNRGMPLYSEGSSANVGLEYVAHGFARLPVAAHLAYGALVTVAAWHMVWGWARWTGWTPAQCVLVGDEGRKARRWRWIVVNGVAGAVALLWFAGGFGVVASGGLAQGWQAGVYNGLYRQLPLLGRWI